MNQLVCQRCGTTYALHAARWRCACGSLLDIDFSPVFDLARIAGRALTMWRYREALPIQDDAHVVTLGEGFTPLTTVALQQGTLLVKQDHLFPSGSYKDRGAAVLVSQVSAMGITRVVEDSSGNAGAAIAAYCAAAGIDCTIYVPESTAAAKVAQIAAYGATLRRVPGSREDTARAALEAADDTYYASHSWNPFFFQGTKTFAYEVCEQLGWRAPDAVVLPVGNGTLLLGAQIGFGELRAASVIGRVPKLIGVQSSQCAPLYKAFCERLDAIPAIDKGDTLAEGIAIANPIRGIQIMDAVRGSGGRFVAVTDDEIVASLKEMCRKGHYIEPTSAAAIAGAAKYLCACELDEVVVSVFTGHGLKATEKMLRL